MGSCFLYCKEVCKQHNLSDGAWSWLVIICDNLWPCQEDELLRLKSDIWQVASVFPNSFQPPRTRTDPPESPEKNEAGGLNVLFVFLEAKITKLSSNVDAAVCWVWSDYLQKGRELLQASQASLVVAWRSHQIKPYWLFATSAESQVIPHFPLFLQSCPIKQSSSVRGSICNLQCEEQILIEERSLKISFRTLSGWAEDWCEAASAASKRLRWRRQDSLFFLFFFPSTEPAASHGERKRSEARAVGEVSLGNRIVPCGAKRG